MQEYDNLGKAFSRKASQERKGKTIGYQTWFFHPIGVSLLLLLVFEFLCGICAFA
jgi:hypothetical protein